MGSIRRTLAVAAAASLVLGACTNDDATDASDGDGDPSAAAADGEAEAGEPSGDSDADDADTDTDGDEEPDGPTSIDLDETEDHPNGSTMTVTGLELDDDGIFVSFELYNGHDTPLTMALYGEDPHNASEFVQLIDDTGRSFLYQGPSDNPSLELEPDNEMAARIGFRGSLGDDATSVTLRFNYNKGLDRPVHIGRMAEGTPHPTFIFEDLPLPGR